MSQNKQDLEFMKPYDEWFLYYRKAVKSLLSIKAIMIGNKFKEITKDIKDDDDILCEIFSLVDIHNPEEKRENYERTLENRFWDRRMRYIEEKKS